MFLKILFVNFDNQFLFILNKKYKNKFKFLVYVSVFIFYFTAQFYKIFFLEYLGIVRNLNFQKQKVV
jgi:hypothetical protein